MGMFDFASKLLGVINHATGNNGNGGYTSGDSAAYMSTAPNNGVLATSTGASKTSTPTAAGPPPAPPPKPAPPITAAEGTNLLANLGFKATTPQIRAPMVTAPVPPPALPEPPVLVANKPVEEVQPQGEEVQPPKVAGPVTLPEEPAPDPVVIDPLTADTNFPTEIIGPLVKDTWDVGTTPLSGSRDITEKPKALDGGASFESTTNSQNDPLITRVPDNDTSNPRQPDMLQVFDPNTGVGDQLFEGSPGSPQAPSGKQYMSSQSSLGKIVVNTIRAVGGVLLKSPTNVATSVRNLVEELFLNGSSLVAGANEVLSKYGLGTVNQEGRQMAEAIKSAIQEATGKPLPNGTFTTIDSGVPIPMDGPAIMSDGFPDQVAPDVLPKEEAPVVVSDNKVVEPLTGPLDFGTKPTEDITPPTVVAEKTNDAPTSDVVNGVEPTSGFVINLNVGADLTAEKGGMVVVKVEDKPPVVDQPLVTGDTVSLEVAQEQLNALGFKTDPMSFMSSNAANANELLKPGDIQAGDPTAFEKPLDMSNVLSFPTQLGFIPNPGAVVTLDTNQGGVVGSMSQGNFIPVITSSFGDTLGFKAA